MEQSRKDFVAFLKETLIPDLRESDMEATAASFAAAILFIEGAEVVYISDDNATTVR